MAGIHRAAQPAVSPAWADRRRPRVLRRGAGLSGMAAAAALVAACGSSGGSAAAGSAAGSGYGGTSGAGGSGGSAAAASTTVMAHQLSGIGKVLVNGSGMTVYSVKSPSEKNGNIKCVGACTSFWFPVTAGSASLGGSGLPGKLGTVHRPDGKTQVTYNGSPLYTFRLDTAPGQAHGNNYTDSFNGTSFTWQVMTASGKPAAGGGGGATPASSSSSGSGGYGY